MLKPNEHIKVKYYEARTVEDDYQNGESLDGSSAVWDSDDCPVAGDFGTVEAAIRSVCEANYFKYNRESWIDVFKDTGEEYDRGRFDGDVLVDEDNSEATPNDVELWKAGKKRLWNCHLVVKLVVAADPRSLTNDELAF